MSKRSNANLGVFKGSDIAYTCPDKLNIPEFAFSAVTRKELYSVIDSTITKQQDPVNINFSHKVMQISCRRLFALNEWIKEKLPTEMQLAYVSPILKIGNKLDSRHRRSSSVTRSSATISERLVLTLMTELNDKHKTINKEQIGFQKKKSATMKFLQMIESVSFNLDESKETFGFFVDLPKVFNYISHKIFL